MAVRTRLLLLALTGLLAAAFAGFGLIATRSGFGDRVDYEIWSTVLNGLPGWLRQSLDRFAREIGPIVLTVLAAGLVLLGLARRQWRRVAGGLVVASLAVVLTAPVHLQDATGPIGGSYPSNHATVDLGLLASVLVLWPVPVRRWGLWVAAGLAYVLCLGNVSWYAHAPRDVVGSVLAVVGVVAATVAVLGPGVLNLAEERPEG